MPRRTSADGFVACGAGSSRASAVTSCSCSRTLSRSSRASVARLLQAQILLVQLPADRYGDEDKGQLGDRDAEHRAGHGGHWSCSLLVKEHQGRANAPTLTAPPPGYRWGNRGQAVAGEVAAS